MIVVDTLRQDHLGAYGYSRPVSPVLDDLAARGVRADGLAPAPWTRPSMATVMTGLHPLRHQVAASTDRIPAAIPTLAERLRSRGFTTFGISTNGHVSEAWGFARGFETFLPTWKLGFGLYARSEQVNSLLLPRLGELAEPYFLFVHYLDPHQPYDPRVAFDGGSLPEELARRAPLREGEVYPTRAPVDAATLRAANDLYDGEIRSNDEEIGRLMAALRELGLDRDTLFVFTSDHGEEFFEHGRSGHGKSLYAEVTAVPLIFFGDGLVCPGAVIGRVGLEDIAPTVLAMLDGAPLGTSSAGEFDGIDQSRALRCGGELRSAPRLLYVEGDPDAGLALVEGARKLLLTHFPYGKAFFDQRSDPGEQRDLWSAPETAAERDADTRLLAERYNDLVRRSFERDTTTANQELSEQLAALGYGGADNPIAARRTFPRRIQPADPVAGGLRGWEDAVHFSPCPDLRTDPARQLLDGWWPAMPGEAGRWTAPHGTFALPGPSRGEARVHVRGINYRPDTFHLRLAPLPIPPASGQPRAASGWEGDVAPGRFELDLPLGPASPSPYRLVRFDAEPPFVPREHGLDDDRTLGVFLESVCLEGAGGD
ncbi:MAG: sulfatase [Thermoanaerobaculia bacterium]